MSTYKVRPRTVEAFRWQGQPLMEWPIWAQHPELLTHSGSALYAYTKNGPIRVNRGDWCILGDKEILPCTHDEFQKQYEPLPFSDQPADGRSPQELGTQYRDYARE